MSKLITGLHHITALASNAQKNVDFYSGILGLRLVKRTVNFDAPDVYHLYFGDEQGTPGTILTFFPFPDMPKGRKGKGQLTVISFSIPENSFEYWIKRLKSFGVEYKLLEPRFGEDVIYFEDHDGLGLEFVVNKNDKPSSFTYGNIPLKFAIKGFYGITLSEECEKKTGDLLSSKMDYQLISQEGNRFRFSPHHKETSFVDIICNPDALRGVSGFGTVHHVAFATATSETQIEARDKLLKFGLNVTPVLNREYFYSIYFREPGGVLFEIATNTPGFTVDEPLETLGDALKLPPSEEHNRPIIEKELPIIKLNIEMYKDS